MTEVSKTVKQSYTTSLLQTLESQFVHLKGKDKKMFEGVLQSIKDFAEERKKIYDAEREASASSFTWGKYSGKQIAEVFKLDKSYCEWALKSSYLREEHKEIITGLLM